MNINHLVAFVHVVDSGSLSRAALKLKQPKSRISRWLKSLEGELGKTLVYRSTRQLSLTDEGEKLYRDCKDKVYALEGIFKKSTEIKDECSGRLRITCPEDFGTFLLPSIISELLSRYPRINTDIILSNRDRNLIKEGIDVAIHFGKPRESELKSLLIGYVRFIVVVGKNYLKHNPQLHKISDLVQHKIIWFSLGNEQERWNLLKEKGRTKQNIDLHVFHRSNNSRFLLSLALQNEGVALLPEFICKDYLNSGELVRVLDTYEADKAPAYFIWPNNSEVNLKTKEFIKIAREKLDGYFVNK